MSDAGDRWLAGDAYERYMGRWSRAMAPVFLDWLRAPVRAHWLEVGCGTGALTTSILASADPASIAACDPSDAFIEHARSRLGSARVTFTAGSADALPLREGGFDVAVSGLVLNFLPEPRETLAALRQRLRPGGTIAAYVWDYAGGMAFLRAFWDEAVALEERAAAVDEGRRFPLCAPPALHALFERSGLSRVDTGALEIETRFADFDDYWEPFLRGTGPAPAFVASLEPPARDELRERLQRRLRPPAGRELHLRARAWCVRGVSA